MKTKQQILDYLKSQEWFDELAIIDNIRLLFPIILWMFRMHPEHDWTKIYNDFEKWLKSEE